jgi:2'-5' RNA ligase
LSGLNCHEAKSLGKTVRALQQKVFGEWTARELKLVRSQLFPQGARHEVVAAIDFFGK